MNYLYDNSFGGFLTCVYMNWYKEKAEGVFPEDAYQLDICRFAMSVETDEAKAGRVLDAITRKISKWDAQRVYQVFCSKEPEKEMKLLRYIEYGFARGPKIRLLHGDPVVKAVEAAEKRVGIEVHRLCGLIRFSEVKRYGEATLPGRGRPPVYLYAKIEPDNDVLEFLAPHFSDRFKSEPIIIHDLGREKALFAFERRWEIAAFATDAVAPTGSGMERVLCENGDGSVAPLLENTGPETDYRALWKQYFDAMATRERKNPRCQRNFMPTRYWKHLTEMND